MIVHTAGTPMVYAGPPFPPLLPQPADPFARYFGAADPLVVIAAAIAVGFASMVVLNRRYRFAIHGPAGGRGMALAAAGATLLAVLMVLVDVSEPFPRDLNVPLPEGLWFYPVIALVVESLFHLAPLLGLLWLLRRVTGWRPETALWVGIGMVALLEPTFQLVIAESSGQAGWVQPYLVIHLLAFNLLQLALFRRYGLLTMLTVRWVYYLYWHVLWGSLRLTVLF